MPFRDATSGSETYGGGRYLVDTVKCTDGGSLELTPGSPEVMVDFNYAYHPSCAYSPRWACPLAPAENRLRVAVRAGERMPAWPASDDWMERGPAHTRPPRSPASPRWRTSARGADR